MIRLHPHHPLSRNISFQYFIKNLGQVWYGPSIFVIDSKFVVVRYYSFLELWLLLRPT